MSLPVLVAIVVLGIALSVAAVHFTGGSKTATLIDPDQASRRFAEDFPKDRSKRDDQCNGGQHRANAVLECFQNGRGRKSRKESEKNRGECQRDESADFEADNERDQSKHGEHCIDQQMQV